MLSAVAPPSFAQPSLAEQRVHEETAGKQSNSALATNAAGQAVVVWESWNGESDSDVFAQRVGSSGVLVGERIPLNVTTDGLQTAPCVSVAENGIFVATWLHQPPGGATSIRGRIFTADGTPQSAELDLYSAASVDEHDLGADGAGNFVAVWTEGPQGSNVIKSHRFFASGAFGRVIHHSATVPGAYTQPTVSMRPSGQFILSWVTGSQGSNLVLQRFNELGGTTFESPIVVTNGTNLKHNVMNDPAGWFAVAWVEPAAPGSPNPFVLKVKDYRASGDLFGERTVSTNVSAFDAPHLANYSGTGYLPVWAGSGQLGARAYPASLDSGSSEFRISSGNDDTFASTAMRRGRSKAVAVDGNGQALVTWCRPDAIGSSDTDVFVSRFSVPSWNVATANGFIFDSNNATIHGIARARGETLNVWFEYGLTAAYGKSYGHITTNSPNAVLVSAGLEALKPHTVYHYRLVGEDSQGRIYGEDRTIQTPNRPPIATDDNLHQNFNWPGNPMELYFVLESDSDPDGDSIHFVSTTQGQHGTVEIAGATLLYFPNEDYNGNDTFQYVISDGNGGTDTATVTLRNILPIVPDKTLHAPIIGEPMVVFDTELDFTDPDDYQRGFSWQSSFPKGTLDQNLAQNLFVFEFTSTGIVGEAKIPIDWMDFHGVEGTVTITLTNAAPHADSIAASTANGPVTVDLSTKISDPDDDALIIDSVSQGSTGTVAISGNHSVTYTPGAEFEGRDTFTYTVSDRRGGVATASVEVRSTELAIRVLGRRGDAVVGITDPSEPAIWRSFGIPSIAGNSAGWSGRVRAAGAEFVGIFTGDPDAPTLHMRTGDPVPNTLGEPNANVSFKLFREPVFGGESTFAVIAQVGGRGVRASEKTGLWLKKDGLLRQIARLGGEAPGVSGGTFGAFLSLVMNEEHEAFFLARLRRGGSAKIGAANDLGVWHWSEGNGLQLLVRTGDQIELEPGNLQPIRNIQTLTAVTGSPGENRVRGDLPMRLQFTKGVEAIGVCGPSGVSILRKTEESLRGLPNQFGAPDILDSASEIVSTALTIVDPNSPGQKVFQSIVHTGLESPLAVEGREAPGTFGERFRGFEAPIVGSGAAGDLVAFAAQLTGPAAKNSGIWVWKSGEPNDPAILVRKGDAAPGIEGATFAKFDSVAILPNYGVIYTATLVRGPGGINAGNDKGIWAVDSSGDLRLIARESDPVAILDESKVLQNFEFLGAVSVSPGQKRGYSGEGRIIYRATFTDGTNAVIRATIP